MRRRGLLVCDVRASRASVGEDPIFDVAGFVRDTGFQDAREFTNTFSALCRIEGFVDQSESDLHGFWVVLLGEDSMAFAGECAGVSSNSRTALCRAGLVPVE